MDHDGDEYEPADRDQPGHDAVAVLAGVEHALKQARQPPERLQHRLPVRQGPHLLDQQNGDQCKKCHAHEMTITRQQPLFREPNGPRYHSSITPNGAVSGLRRAAGKRKIVVVFCLGRAYHRPQCGASEPLNGAIRRSQRVKKAVVESWPIKRYSRFSFARI